jgi:hypothetical protein
MIKKIQKGAKLKQLVFFFFLKRGLWIDAEVCIVVNKIETISTILSFYYNPNNTKVSRKQERDLKSWPHSTTKIGNS